jgi:hypothetical protein
MRLDRNDSLRFAKRRVFGLNRQALQPVGEREYPLKNKAGFSRASRPASAKEGEKGKAEVCREAALKRAESIKR